MILVTGGAGFIGSALVSALNARGQDEVVIVDHLHQGPKWKNLKKLRFWDYCDREALFDRLDHLPTLTHVIHLGACSSTTETDSGFLMRNNFGYSVALAEWAIQRGIRLIVASSAATYGDGGHGYEDDASQLQYLSPLNAYGYSKHAFDQVAQRRGWLNQLASVKFFNVFGPNEDHKGSMASMVYHSFHQIQATGKVRLFKSHRPECEDGGQQRDFIFIRDAVAEVLWLMDHPERCGLFNVGTGLARSFKDLALAVFTALNRPPQIEYIDMPPAIRAHYQYFTEARMSKIRSLGFDHQPFSLEQAVQSYVQQFLLPDETLGWIW
jgi:ADP-L-glycero-D-manno-heptose 6-epimerase